MDEQLRVEGPTTSYEAVEEMQVDLDTYCETYNRNLPTPGPALKGGRFVRSSRRASGAPDPEQVNREGTAA
ncbi:MAG: hypothetical protein OXH08_12085 [Gammaproteobacteria bacterium]|nr:hypothetical protein [Gammaproteobacteria bacterium]